VRVARFDMRAYVCVSRVRPLTWPPKHRSPCHVLPPNVNNAWLSRPPQRRQSNASLKDTTASHQSHPAILSIYLCFQDQATLYLESPQYDVPNIISSVSNNWPMQYVVSDWFSQKRHCCHIFKVKTSNSTSQINSVNSGYIWSELMII
jgi:hypothetical protein